MSNQDLFNLPDNKQYRDSRNLAARAALHQRYSTNKFGWYNWVFSQLDIKSGQKYLEVGCGPAYLWQSDGARLPAGCEITLTDLSPGMLREAAESLTGFNSISYAVADAAQLPFPEAFFDGVIANHMLYHVRSVPDTLDEIIRVLKPGSCLFAATNGKNHLAEIRDWRKQFFPNQDQNSWNTPVSKFSLTNGRDVLSRFFFEIHLLLFPDQLQVTEIDPILHYINSYGKEEINQIGLSKLRNYLSAELEKDRAIRIRKETGLYIARKP